MTQLTFWLAIEAMYQFHCRRIWWVPDTQERRRGFVELNLLESR